MPAAGAQVAEDGAPARGFVEVERLRVELLREFLDLLGRQGHRAQVANAAGREVFPVVLDTAHQRPPETSINDMVV
jgi:hypothetical protein